MHTLMAQRRQDRGWRQGQLARCVGTHQSHLSDFESGKRRLPARLAAKLARVLGLPAHILQDAVPEAESPTAEQMQRALGREVATQVMELYGGRRLPSLAEYEADLGG